MEVPSLATSPFAHIASVSHQWLSDASARPVDPQLHVPGLILRVLEKLVAHTTTADIRALFDVAIFLEQGFMEQLLCLAQNSAWGAEETWYFPWGTNPSQSPEDVRIAINDVQGPFGARFAWSWHCVFKHLLLAQFPC